MREWTLRLPYTTPPLSLNQRQHFHARARIVKEVRGTVMALARAAGIPTGLSRVEVQLLYIPRDRRRRDTDNLVATLKAVCDALAAGTKTHPGLGIVPDDTPRWMAKPEPVICDPDSRDPHLLVVVTELDPIPGGAL